MGNEANTGQQLGNRCPALPRADVSAASTISPRLGRDHEDSAGPERKRKVVEVVEIESVET